jgi:hypothetical protein
MFLRVEPRAKVIKGANWKNELEEMEWPGLMAAWFKPVRRSASRAC